MDAIISYPENSLNLNSGLYGFRDAPDIRPSETLLGFAASALAGIVSHLEYLGQKAISNSRAKKAYVMLTKKNRKS